MVVKNANSDFIFASKICNAPAALKASDFKNNVATSLKPTCAKSGNAYLLNSNGECPYSFDGAILTPIATDKVIKGYNLAYTSKEPCAEDNAKKFTFNLMAVCNKDVNNENTTASVRAGKGLSEPA